MLGHQQEPMVEPIVESMVQSSSGILSSLPLTEQSHSSLHSMEQSSQESLQSTVQSTIQSAIQSQSTVQSTIQSTVQSQPIVKQESKRSKRVMITKMILFNFKSYHGRIEIGPFHHKFSSIVGPNGSGKSNVIDALLFVFGFKAKKLRQHKASDLIHKSSLGCPDSAFVQLEFQEIMDNDGGYDVIPGSEFSIKKSVTSSDVSTYYINDKKTSWSSVSSFIKAFGIDLDHKRFLILQGEVESIALMKPKGLNDDEDGLLEYLEDIIGTSNMKEPIENALLEVQRLQQEYDHCLVQFKHVQKETNQLRSQSQDACKYIEWENRVATLQSLVLQLQRFQLEKELELKKDALVKIEQDLMGIVDDQQEKESQVLHLQQELQTLQEKSKVIKEQTLNSNRELNELEKFQVQQKEMESFLQQKKKKWYTLIQKVKHERCEDQSWISNFDQDVKKARDEMNDLQVRFEKEQVGLQEIQDSLKGKTSVFIKEIEKKQLDLSPLLEKKNEQVLELQVLESEFDLIHEKINRGKKVVEEQESLLSMAFQSNTKMNQDVTSIATQLKELQEEWNEKKELKMNLEQQEKVLFEKVRGSKSKLQDLIQLQKQQQDRGQVYGKVMSQKKSGHLSGICGRLGDLGTIDKKYDVAITTACSSLDSIVVETVQDAQACIEYLKKEQVGRANFLCLDKLSSTKSSKFSSADIPNGVARLFDLIQPSHERFLPAFYHGLSDTLVVDDLDQANRVAFGSSKKRFRVVTLDGQLIDTSGTISGGGNVIKRGGMSMVSKQENQGSINQLENEVNDLQAQYEVVQSRILHLNPMIESLQNQIQELDMNQSRLKLEIESNQVQIKDFQASIETAKKNMKADPVDIQRSNELEKKILKTKSSLEKLLLQCKPIEDEIKECQDQIMQVGGVRLRTQKAKVDSLSDQITQQQLWVSKLLAEKQGREKRVLKSVSVIEKHEGELIEIEKELDHVTQEYQESIEKYQVMKQENRDLNEEFEQVNEKVDEEKSKLQEKISILNKTRALQVGMKAEMASIKHIISSNEKKIEKCGIELEQISLVSTGLEDDDEEPTPLPVFDAAELEKYNIKQVTAELEKTRNYFSGTVPNLGVLREYKTKMKLYKEKSEAVELCAHARDSKKAEYDDLRKQRLDTFMTGFTAISLKLKEMYQMITMGGNAELELVDSLDPFSEGVLFSVMPPKKSWKNITNLSGGEKTLSSLALVFALHHFKPTPIYVMDEIDAALDFRNVSIIANYIKQRTSNAQFIIISLRNNMFELADRLVGIYKTENQSKSITIDPLLGTVEQ